jgi:hypothetical protein
MTRVRRLSDGKVFSSPKGVALAYDKPISKAVYYCCRGYILAVEGERFEWAYDDDEDRGYVEYEESYWNRKGKWTTRGWILKWRAQFIKLWLDRIADPHRWRKSSEVAEGISEAATASEEQYKWRPNSSAISKHFRTYESFYAEIFGMHMHEMNTPMYKGRMFKFIKADANVEYDAVLEELANDRNWGRGKPVIRTNDNQWFRSIAETERLTEIPYYRILHCCEGDLDVCEVPLTGERMTFKYATEVSE